MSDQTALSASYSKMGGITLAGRHFENIVEVCAYMRTLSQHEDKAYVDDIITQMSVDVWTGYESTVNYMQRFVSVFMSTVQQVIPESAEPAWWKQRELLAAHATLEKIRKKQKQERKVTKDNRIDYVIDAWGDAGKYLAQTSHHREENMPSTPSHGKAEQLGGFAKECGDWSHVVHYINRVIFERRSVPNPKITRLVPGVTDISRARKLFNEQKSTAPRLTQEEIAHLEKVTNRSYNFDRFGLLAYRAADDPTSGPGRTQTFEPEATPSRQLQHSLADLTPAPTPSFPLKDTQLERSQADLLSHPAQPDDESDDSMGNVPEIPLCGGFSDDGSSELGEDGVHLSSQTVQGTRFGHRTDEEMSEAPKPQSAPGNRWFPSSTYRLGYLRPFFQTASNETSQTMHPARFDAQADTEITDGSATLPPNELGQTVQGAQFGNQAENQMTDAPVTTNENGPSSTQVEQPEDAAQSSATINENGSSSTEVEQPEDAAQSSAITNENGPSSTEVEQPEDAAQSSVTTNNNSRSLTKDCKCHSVLSRREILALMALPTFDKHNADGEDSAISFIYDIHLRLHQMEENLSKSRKNILCATHATHLASTLNLKIPKSNAECIRRLAIVAEYATDRARWYKKNVNHKKRAGLFHHGKVKVITKNINLLEPFRFQPVEDSEDPPQESWAIPHTSESLAVVLKDTLERCGILDYPDMNSFETSGLGIFSSLFAWWNEGKISLSSIAQEEIQTFEHHLRQKYKMENVSNPVRKFYQFSLTQQAMSTDLLLFIVLNCIRPHYITEERNAIDPRMTAIPLPAIYAHNGHDEPSIRMHNPDFFRDLGNWVPTYAIVPLEHKVQYYASAIGTSTENACSFLEDVGMSEELGYSALALHIDYEVIKEAFDADSEKCPISEGQVTTTGALLWHGGIPINPFRKPERDDDSNTLAYQLCFQHPDFDDMIGNDDLQKATLGLLPLHGRNGHYVPYARFTPPFYQKPLSCIDPLGECILSHQPWNFAAKSIAELLLGENREAAWAYIQQWQRLTRDSIITQWAELRRREELFYGTRSLPQYVDASTDEDEFEVEASDTSDEHDSDDENETSQYDEDEASAGAEQSKDVEMEDDEEMEDDADDQEMELE